MMDEFSFSSFFLSVAVILAFLFMVLQSGGFVPRYTRDIDCAYDDDDDDDEEDGGGGDTDHARTAKKYKTLALSLLAEIDADRRQEKVDVWKLIEDDLKTQLGTV